MIKVDLKCVSYPKNLPENVEKEAKKRHDEVIDALLQGDKEKGIAPKSQEDAERIASRRFPVKKFEPAKEFEDTINDAILNWMQKEHFDKEAKRVIAPWEVRKMSGRISNKIVDADNGEFELSDEQLDFLVKVFQSDLPPATYFYYVGEYLEELKASASQKDKDGKKK